MPHFYFVRDSLSHIFNFVLKNSKGILPTDQKKVFITLFFAIFSTITGVGIVVPLLPVYAGHLGASGLYIGMIFGSFSISRTLLLPYFGRLSDSKGRKPFIVGGLCAYTLISIAFVFSDSIESLIVLRFIQGAGSAMIMPVVQAYVGEITTEGAESYSMGLFNLSMFLSLSLGPLMGGSIQEIFSLDTAFICMGFLSALGLLLCVFFLPPVALEKGRANPLQKTSWRILLKEMDLAGLFFFRYAYTACIGIIWSFLPLFADQNFNLPGSLIGILAMLGVFVSGILSLPMGWVADHANKNILVVTGGLFSAYGMFLLFQADTFSGLVTGVCLFGLGGGISMPSIMGYAVLKGDEKKAMGTVMSVMTVAHSLGMLTGALAAGLAVDFLSLRVSFLSGTVGMAAGILFFIFARIKFCDKKG